MVDTISFNPTNCIERGSFGSVFLGKLTKKLFRSLFPFRIVKIKKEKFLVDTKVLDLTRNQHPNILLYFCTEQDADYT